MTSVVPASVARSKVLLRPALEAALDRLHPTLGRVARYHRGWADQAGVPIAGGGGKALRPALAVLGAQAAWAPGEVALPGAVATELVHDFSLLHDDLMDGDRERRHRPTAWTVFGPGPAILAGDALLSLATDLLLEVEGPAGAAARQLLATAVRRLVHGQADDLDLESSLQVGVADYVTMAAGKTGALMSCACAIGAALAGAEARLVLALGDFGEHLGLAFQLVDDLLGMWGAPAITGKPVLSDLRSRKKSAPIVFALTGGGRAALPLRDYLTGSAPADEDELAGLARLVERLGGRERTTGEIQRGLALAETSLAGLDLPTEVRSELLATARYVTARDR